jgi:rubredoxin
LKGKDMQKWECSVCGYIYDPEIGDVDSGIDPGTSFENLPADWICPDCGASKEEFDALN